MKKILWVEDEYKSFRSFSFAIKDSYEIVRAEDYVDAVNKFSVNNFDIYIVDIIIPGGGKYSSVEEIFEKRREKFFGLKFIEYLIDKGCVKPIIALTVVREQEFIDKINRIDNSIKIIWKYDSDGESLLDIVNELLAN